MATEERSAGVIVFRNDVAGVRQYLLLDYGRYYDYAKGHVEPGEDDKTAALREVREETGIEGVELYRGFAHELTYYFRGKSGLVRKTVVLFAGQVTSDRVAISDEHVGHVWLPFPEALERLYFATAKEALNAANTFLESR